MEIRLTLPVWNITEETGYVPKTTFWDDFSIADKFGLCGIKDTYQRVKTAWSGNCKYWTELCLVLNHKIWYWHQKNKQKAALYDQLWRDAIQVVNEWSDEEQAYYYEVTD